MEEINISVRHELTRRYSSDNQQDAETIPLAALKALYARDADTVEITKPNSDNKFVTESLLAIDSGRFPNVRRLSPFAKKRVLVTGGAGFVGSHLVDRLMLMGHDVICVDNFFTGQKSNIVHWMGHPNFELIRHDVVDSLLVEVDQIYHLACPASPVHYQSNPVKTLKTGFFGTYNMLGLAKRVKARILIASTSEIYGDPEQHPQKETYWGNVNCTGPRACYDEGKRVSETLAYSYAKQDGVDVRVARIFNTFGPRMNWNDGRVVSNFILQALKDENLTIYGDGKSTRSFQFVLDLIDGLIKLMNSDYSGPVNLGNSEEFTVRDFAEKIISLVSEQQPEKKCTSEIITLPGLEDDPHRRKPDTSLAEKELGWQPKWSVEDGLVETIAYFQRQIKFFGV